MHMVTYCRRGMCPKIEQSLTLNTLVPGRIAHAGSVLSRSLLHYPTKSSMLNIFCEYTFNVGSIPEPLQAEICWKSQNFQNFTARVLEKVGLNSFCEAEQSCVTFRALFNALSRLYACCLAEALAHCNLLKPSGQLFSWLTDPTTVMLSVDPTAPTSLLLSRPNSY